MGTGVAAALVAAAVLASAPNNGGVLSPVRITINDGAGDQFDPHVDGDLAAYSSSIDTGFELIEQIHSYDFTSGIDAPIPNALADGGVGRDLLSDIDQGRIVFTRIFGNDRRGIMLFDHATNTVTELAPAPNTNRLGVALGADTAAFIDYGLSGDATGELVILGLSPAGQLPQRITNDLIADFNPAVSPDGNTVTWERCLISQANCDIFVARRIGAIWQITPLTTSVANEVEADTTGSRVVFQRESFGPTGIDLVVMPVTGGSELTIELPGDQRHPSIRGNIIAFEGRPDPFLDSDIFLVDLETNRVFQITDTNDVDETLNDVTVLPGGEIRVVWQANDDPGLVTNNIYGATFVLPAAPVVDAGNPTPDAGVCGGAVTLDATRTYCPNHWTDDTETLNFPVTIPATLPVVAGNSANKSATLTFETAAGRLVCKYKGGSWRAHPTSPADLAAAANYVFDRCTLEPRNNGNQCGGHRRGGGHNGGGHGGGGHGGGGWGGGGWGDDDDDDDDHPGNGGGGGNTPTYGAGSTVNATSVTLRVQEGDSHQPSTRVRVTLREACGSSQHPLDAAGAPDASEGGPNAGCSSTGSNAFVPMFIAAALLLLLRRQRRPAEVRLVRRR